MNTFDGLNIYSRFVSRGAHLFEVLEKCNVSSRVVRAWDVGGLLSPQWNEDGSLNRFWVNVIAHQVAAAVVGYKLASSLKENIALSGFSIADIVEALLVHDSFKRREQEAKDFAKKEGLDIGLASRGTEDESEHFLLRLGFGKAVSNLAGATGDKGLEIMLDGKVNLAKKIVFYADCCVSNDEIVGYSRRFDDLKVHFQPGGRYDYVDKMFLGKYGKTHREVYDSVVIPIEKELAKLLGFLGNPKNLHTLFVV